MAYFLEIWPKDESARLELLQHDAGEILSIEKTDEPNGKQELKLILPFANVTASNFAHNNYVRLCDGDIANDPYTAYRIKSVTRSIDGTKKTLLVNCEHIKADIVEQIVSSKNLYIQQTPDDILDDILSSYASGWSRGTVTNGTTIIESFEIKAGATVYETIKDLANTINVEVYCHAEGDDTGHDADWQNIDLVEIDNTINGTPGTCTFDDAVNIQSLSKNQDIRDNFYTRLYIIGGDSNKGVRDNEQNNQTMTVEGALFTIKAYAANIITLYTKNLLVADDSLNGYLVQIKSGGSWSAAAQIVDSIKWSTGDRLSFSSLTVTPAEGDILAVLYDASTLIDFIPSGQSETTYGVISDKYENNKYEDFVNQLGPIGRSDFSGTYAGGVCQGWAEIGSPTCTEDATAAYIVNGTKCQKVVANSDGDGLYRDFDPVVDAGEQYAVSFKIRLTVTALDADTFIHMRIKYDTDQYWPPGNIEIKEGGSAVRILGTTFSTPRAYAIQGGNIEYVNGQTPRFEIYASGGGGTFYIDSVELVFLPYIPMPKTFVPYDSRVLLWEVGCKHAKEKLTLNQDYSIKVVDLYENDRTTNAAYEFKAGDEVTITHSDLGISDTVRVMQKTVPNMLKPTDCNIKIESVDNGIAAKVSGINNSLKRINQSIATNSERANAGNRAGMSGFYSVTEEDSSGNILRVGKYVDESLINGVWVTEDANGRKRYTKNEN